MGRPALPHYVPTWFAPGWNGHGHDYNKEVIDPLFLGGKKEYRGDKSPWAAWASRC